MHDAILCEIGESLEDVLDEMPCFLLCQEPFFLDEHVEVSAVADLRDDEALALVVEDVVAFQDVRVVDLHQDLQLGSVQLLQLLGLERRQLYDFYGHHFSYVDGGIPVVSLRPE